MSKKVKEEIPVYIVSKDERVKYLKCPICGKEFIKNADTMYIAGGGFDCSWKCFLKKVRGEDIDDSQQE